MRTTARISVDHYLAHDFPPRMQLVAGEVVVVNEPSFRYVRIAASLYDFAGRLGPSAPPM